MKQETKWARHLAIDAEVSDSKLLSGLSPKAPPVHPCKWGPGHSGWRIKGGLMLN